MKKRYEFKVFLAGEGATIEEAWVDAVEHFSLDPGEPSEVIETEEFDKEGTYVRG